jgi:hypothetical protein
VADPAAGHRGDPGDPLHRGRQPLQPGQQHVGQPGRQRAVRVDPGGQQLLGEVGISLGAGQHVADQPVGDRSAPDRAQVVGQLGRGERVQLQPLDRRQPAQLAEQRPQRVTPVQVIGPVGRDHGEPLGPQPGQQEGEQLAGRLVGPVQVLDDQQQRGAGFGRVAEHAGHRVEQLQPTGVLVGAGRGSGRPAGPGDQPVERGPVAQRLGQRLVAGVGQLGELPQRLGERQVGQADRAEVDAVADEDRRPAVLRPPGQLGEQPRLAHAGLAAQQHRGRRPGPGALDRGGQPGELVAATDQRSVGPWPGHAVIVPRPYDRT